MANCATCGFDMGDRRVCPNCGELAVNDAEGASGAENANGAENTNSAENANSAYQEQFVYEQPVDAPPAVMPVVNQDTQEKDISDNKAYAILSYIGILCLIPLFAAPKTSPFVRVHLTQGLTIFAAEVILGILSSMPVIIIFSGLISLVTLVFSIMGIVNAAKGTMNKLPLVEKLDLLKMLGLGWPKE